LLKDQAKYELKEIGTGKYEESGDTGFSQLELDLQLFE